LRDHADRWDKKGISGCIEKIELEENKIKLIGKSNRLTSRDPNIIVKKEKKITVPDIEQLPKERGSTERCRNKIEENGRPCASKNSPNPEHTYEMLVKGH
jgi:predicted RNA-binding protein